MVGVRIRSWGISVKVLAKIGVQRCVCVCVCVGMGGGWSLGHFFLHLAGSQNMWPVNTERLFIFIYGWRTSNRLWPQSRKPEDGLQIHRIICSMSIKNPETCRRTRKNDTRAGGTIKNMQLHVHLHHLHFVCCHLGWNYWREASKSNLAPSPAGEETLYGGAATVQSVGSRARSEVSWLHVRVSRGAERSPPVEEHVHLRPRAVQVSAGRTAQLRWNVE